LKKTDFELLLPVGQIEMAKAAIHNGADAIYVGFPGFNARGRSYDFELVELNEIIELCHLYGVKVNLALNILIFQNELETIIEKLKCILPLKPDALIVQDLGLVRIIRELSPDQVIHASTQMTVTNELAISFVDDLNIKRFVLARENSLHEIKVIQEKTKKELEVFVHGALCVSYSGQCFTSESIGGRSANRGQCAQSCRFQYELLVDGEKKNLVDRNYLVSPQDLCGLADIPELMKIGVASFKVEGRLKSPEYVATVAKSYRQAIDRVLADAPLTVEELGHSKSTMAVEYSRGFFPGWLHGVNHQDLVDGTFSSHRGMALGTITSVRAQGLTFKLSQKMKGDLSSIIENGDGVAWFYNTEKNGASIYKVEQQGSEIQLSFASGTQVSEKAIGSTIYLNHDRSQKKEIDKVIDSRDFQKRIPVSVKLSGSIGQPLSVEVDDGQNQIHLNSESLIEASQKRGLSKEQLFDEYSALSGTVFKLDLAQFVVEVVDLEKSYLAHKDIKKLRQSVFEQLAQLRKSKRVEPSEVQVKMDVTPSVPAKQEHSGVQNRFHVLLRDRNQVDDVLHAIRDKKIDPKKIDMITLDFEFGRDYESSLQNLRDSGLKVGIATTRILKPLEYGNLKVIKRLNPDHVLVRNLGAVEYFKNIDPYPGKLIGDFSLNVTNAHTFEYLTKKGLDSICLSYDLNAEQMEQLLDSVNSSGAEVTIHQSMPSFHMEHCVFAAFLSQGKSFKDCGKPCEKHKVQLKDQFGNHHWIKPDHECRNTMYNSKAQTALRYLGQWQKHGIGIVRFEALNERGQELIDKLNIYIAVLQNEKSADVALQELNVLENYGLSALQLGREIEYRPVKKDHSLRV